MKEAIKQALVANDKNEIPVGAVIVNPITNKIIASAHNLCEQNNNPLLHAEMLVISQACEKLNKKFLLDLDIYVTLEPCPMCAQAISFARLKRLYFGAYDLKSGGVENGASIYNATSCHFKPEIYGGINEEECSFIIKEYFKKLRSID